MITHPLIGDAPRPKLARVCLAATISLITLVFTRQTVAHAECTSPPCYGYGEHFFVSTTACPPIGYESGGTTVSPDYGDGLQIVGTETFVVVSDYHIDIYSNPSDPTAQKNVHMMAIRQKLKNGSFNFAGLFPSGASKSSGEGPGRYRNLMRAAMYVGGADNTFIPSWKEPLDDDDELVNMSLVVDSKDTCKIAGGCLLGDVEWVFTFELDGGYRKTTRRSVPVSRYSHIVNVWHGMLDTDTDSTSNDAYINVTFALNRAYYFDCSNCLEHCTLGPVPSAACPAQCGNGTWDESPNNVLDWGSIRVPNTEDGGWDVHEIALYSGTTILRGHMNDTSDDQFGVCKGNVTLSPCCEVCESSDLPYAYEDIGNKVLDHLPLTWFADTSSLPTAERGDWSDEIGNSIDEIHATFFDLASPHLVLFDEVFSEGDADVVFKFATTETDFIRACGEPRPGDTYLGCNQTISSAQPIECGSGVSISGAAITFANFPGAVWHGSSSDPDRLRSLRTIVNMPGDFRNIVSYPRAPIVSHELMHLFLGDRYDVESCSMTGSNSITCFATVPAFPFPIPQGVSGPYLGSDMITRPNIQDTRIMRCLAHRMPRTVQRGLP